MSAGMDAWLWQPALSHQFVGDSLAFGPSCAFALRHMRPIAPSCFVPGPADAKNELG